MITLQDCRALDARDALAPLRQRFEPASTGAIHLDGNSVGPMPRDVPERLQRLLGEGWRDARRRGWSRFDWLDKPRLLGRDLAPLIGAGPDDVVFADSTSINVFKLLAHAWRQRPERPVVVVERGNFPSDLYAAQGLAHLVNPSDGAKAPVEANGANGANGGAGAIGANGLGATPAGVELRWIDGPEDLSAALDARVGVVLLSHVDYRSSRRWNMAATNALAHAAGARVLWDLSHAAGAIRIALHDDDADYAVGCGYKYLCGGPGAPAWLYVHPKWQGERPALADESRAARGGAANSALAESGASSPPGSSHRLVPAGRSAWPAIPGWMGHADTFGFDPLYIPHPGVQRHLSGTPPVIALEALSGAAAVWREVDAQALGGKHRSLSELAVALVAQRGADFGMRLGSPAAYDERGGHVSFNHEGAGRIVEALVERGVVASFRHPDAIRFGLSPLALSHEDLWWAVDRLHEVLARGLWREERFAKSAV